MSTATATTKIKSNLNSVSNGCDSSLAALKEHITTCLQRWRQKHNSTKHNQHQCLEEEELKLTAAPSNNSKCYYHCLRLNRSNRLFSGNKGEEHSFVKSCRKFYTLQSKTAGKDSNFTTYSAKTGPRKYGRKIEIVAKLLSATLIAKATTKKKNSGQQTDETGYSCFKEHIRIFKSLATTSTTSSSTDNSSTSDAMTILYLPFSDIRQEYPDLDSEIRSILTARAQDGATIPQIRDDYSNLTGTPFPVYDDVTEFLLTIPHVSAYCSEKGTRIFNIRPIEKTKHIHDMVIQQKPQQEYTQKPTGVENRCYYRERERSQNYYPYTGCYSTSNRRTELDSANILVEPDPKVNDKQENLIQATSNSNTPRCDGTEELFKNHCYYQDNCNYLFKRMCNQQYLMPPSSNQRFTNTRIEQKLVPKPVKAFTSERSTVAATSPSMARNNCDTDIVAYKNNVAYLNNLFRLQQQSEQTPYHLNENYLQTNKRCSSIRSLYQNYIPTSSRSSSPTGKSCYTNDTAFTDSDYEAHLLDFLLLGDDFFLYLARMELKCKFKKNQRILQSGLCMSGQTIGAAIKRIRALSDNNRSIILNIGSVDIMQGRQLIQIEHDFRELLLTMLKKGIRPILTTLAPLANYSHKNDIKRMLKRFNDFIKREGQRMNLIVIDIWQCMVNERGHVLFDCYQNEPRNVTGTSEPYLFWNKIGRQRVLQLIESNLEY